MALATVNDVRIRMGRELSTAEEQTVEQLLALAQSLVETKIKKKEADFGDDVPPLISGAVVTVVVRSLANPTALASRSETIGAYSHSETFGRDLASELTLSADEIATLRECAWGRTSGSAQLAATALDDIAEATATEC